MTNSLKLVRDDFVQSDRTSRSEPRPPTGYFSISPPAIFRHTRTETETSRIDLVSREMFTILEDLNWTAFEMVASRAVAAFPVWEDQVNIKLDRADFERLVQRSKNPPAPTDFLKRVLARKK